MKLLLSILSVLFLTPHLGIAQLPELNQKMIDYVDKVTGKKIGNGMCGAFVHKAYKKCGLDINKGYGTKLDTADHNILPGDVVLLRSIEGPGGRISSHIGIIYKVLSPSKFIVADQNHGSRDYVSPTWIMDTNTYWDGKMIFYRPTAENKTNKTKRYLFRWRIT